MHRAWCESNSVRTARTERCVRQRRGAQSHPHHTTTKEAMLLLTVVRESPLGELTFLKGSGGGGGLYVATPQGFVDTLFGKPGCARPLRESERMWTTQTSARVVVSTDEVHTVDDNGHVQRVPLGDGGVLEALRRACASLPRASFFSAGAGTHGEHGARHLLRQRTTKPYTELPAAAAADDGGGGARKSARSTSISPPPRFMMPTASKKHKAAVTAAPPTTLHCVNWPNRAPQYSSSPLDVLYHKGVVQSSK